MRKPKSFVTTVLTSSPPTLGGHFLKAEKLHGLIGKQLHTELRQTEARLATKTRLATMWLRPHKAKASVNKTFIEFLSL